MTNFFRSLAMAGIGLLAATGATAQDRTVDTEPDTYTKLTALQVYLKDGIAAIVAGACDDSIPGFTSEFSPRFTKWRAANWKLIALGAELSVQFKDAKGAPMDRAAVGAFAAQQLRSLAPDAQLQECNKLLQDVSSAALAN
ncbi:MAG: hypothetical protein IIA03_01005 [Proteobacteria bacterium]|jgi:hypothetical protein|nr:hypothetical protein [Burkholderiaceae bacterium]MCH8854844.1 hypothetical protein [Pseudomonadota bacterium]|mmetsp:Transcript_23349/g.55386  ORF Transcript_23349/g.55386 Transcript_23349/m.55386 type:complete len:141 (+) Transcript_23349:1765-2187(+)